MHCLNPPQRLLQIQISSRGRYGTRVGFEQVECLLQKENAINQMEAPMQKLFLRFCVLMQAAVSQKSAAREHVQFERGLVALSRTYR